MALESLLKPVKWADEQILRQYTEWGKKFNLDEGRKRYWTGLGLNLTFHFFNTPPWSSIIWTNF